ncbi:MAG: YqiJ family protein [Gallionella sp.]|nr:YqiJ family protein [Gallionella sp.]MDD4957744.1 YqiJ family protein [Gallionella sp.]
MEFLVAPASLPFTAAIVLVLIMGLVEGVAVYLGFGFSEWLNVFTPEGIDGAADAWLGWLHVGKAPLLVLLVILLTAFSIIGLTLNAVVHDLIGIYPTPFLSVPIAFVGALPVVRILGAAIAHLIPKDETSAVLLDTLVGHVAVVMNGTARVNYPAEAKVKNGQGQTFYVHVEPENEGKPLNTGDSVLLVKQISGTRFLAIANPRPDIL